MKPIALDRLAGVRADSAGSRERLRLQVDVASAAMLRLLWHLQISKGVMSLEQQRAVTVGMRVELVLVVNAVTVALAAAVRSCVPQGAHFLVTIALDELGETQRFAIGKLGGF